MSKTEPKTTVRVRNLPTAIRETPGERRARELFWTKYYWHAAIRRYKTAKAEAKTLRAKIKKLEAGR